MNLEVGKVYSNGKLTREITKIESNNIYYKNQNGKNSSCWITTFEDWVNKGKKNQCKYCSDIQDDIELCGNGGEDLYYNKESNTYHIVIGCFRAGKGSFEIKYCPWCGRKL